MSKNSLIRVLAVLLLGWYLFSVTGFDIHRCSDTPDVYVRSLVAGISCEDIHPDCPCHHHHDDDDCENILAHLSISGDGAELTIAVPDPGSILVSDVTPSVGLSSASCLQDEALSRMPDVPDPPDIVRDLYCVLRV